MCNRIFPLTVSFVTVLSFFTGVSIAQINDHSQMRSMNDMTMSETAKPTVFITPFAFNAQLDRVFTSYLSVQASLSIDELKDAQTSALAFTKSLQDVDIKLLTDMKAHMAWMASSEKLEKDAKHITAAPDIETAREEFKKASDDLIAIAKQFRTSGKTELYVFHCPMALKNKGADWVQDEKTVKNPYLGKAMLACGTITETIGVKSGN